MSVRHLTMAAAILASIVAAQDISPDALEARRLKSGLDAFQRRDFAEAAVLLHAYVFDMDADQADPWAQYALGLMHDQGLGTTEDALLACAFYDLARRVNLGQLSAEAANLAAVSTAAYERACANRNPDEQREINELKSCYRQWPGPAKFDLADRRWVDIDRLRMTIHSGPVETGVRLPINGCSVSVFPLRQTRLGTRDFFDYYYWVSAGPARGAHQAHTLNWTAVEVAGDALAVATNQEVLRTTELAFPAKTLPSEYQNLGKLRTNAKGDVEWIVATNPPRQGTVPRR